METGREALVGLGVLPGGHLEFLGLVEEPLSGVVAEFAGQVSQLVSRRVGRGRHPWVRRRPWMPRWRAHQRVPPTASRLVVLHHQRVRERKQRCFLDVLVAKRQKVQLLQCFDWL